MWTRLSHQRRYRGTHPWPRTTHAGAAWEHATDGVRVNAVGPGFIATPLLTKNLDQRTLDFLATQHALNRLGKPDEVAELVAWLASDGSSFATGTYYPIDGGYLAR